ncbi:tetratricopeptide repeat protein [Candidatus Woesearchaeota archaeon]|nr:tetratricopeptide repeat protein [Candidatus Woesearchaeota archaeon]
MQNKPSLNLCMMTKNEEIFLEQCLSSVKDIADEIIIVDTGSTDKTKEIAKKFNAKIFDFKWIDDFSAARNESIKHATKDWILVLDADETIAGEDLDMLKQLISDEDSVGYYFTIRTYTDNSTAAGWVSSKDDKYKESNSASGWFTTRLIRLFRNNKSIRFNGIMHETIDASIHNLGKVKSAFFPIHHFGRLKDEKSEYKKELYQRLGELKISQKNDFHSYSQLGIQVQENGDYENAIQLFKKSIELNKNYFKSWLNLGACYLKLNKLSDAEYALQQAVLINPSNYSVHNNLGIVYSKLNKAEMAIKEFLTALILNPRSASTYFNLGLAYDIIGANDNAYESFKKAIELNPRYKERINLS